ncbi:MAG TPA: hypothetical protein VKA08_01895 [Balneolales bacterium]|nr:hypothetical protein [Balneolales bacterium]
MKYIVLLTMLWLATMGEVCLGQTTFRKELTWEKGQLIDLNLKFGKNMQVTGWDQNEVAVIARVTINEGHQDSLFSLAASSGNAINILADINRKDLSVHEWLDGCPKEQRMMTIDDHTSLCVDISYEVHIPKNASVNLSSISANMTIHGLHGPVRAKSISGFIDFSMPENAKADLALKSITGELYTNIGGINWLNRKDHIPMVGYLLRGQIGGGGPELHLESISNDIYLRAQK